jgi:reactive intermediate/imine deaminase
MNNGNHLVHILAPAGVAPAPAGGFSQVVAGAGRLVVVSGQISLDQHGELVGKDDPLAQARQVFENLRSCLDAAGATFHHVVKLNYFLTDMRWLPYVRSVREQFIDPEKPPASTAVQVVALAIPDLLLEIEAWALVPEKAS